MRYSEFKEACIKLNNEHCYYRHPKEDFIKILGQDTVNKFLKYGLIKDSAPLTAYWADYRQPCYEFGNMFRKVFNFIVTPFWLWMKIYVLNLYWFVHKWQKLRIALGHRYDWQEYEGVNLNEI